MGSGLQARICAQRQRLFSIACAWCQSPALADDLVQETLARALAKSDSLREQTRLEAWMMRIMMNLYRDHCRREQPLPYDPGMDLSEGEGPEQLVERGDMVRCVRRAIAQLGEEQRQVLGLVDLAEFSYAETARILCVPAGTVMSRLWRARRHLRSLLLQQIGEPGRRLPLGRMCSEN